jgi:hypothetical protein
VLDLLDVCGVAFCLAELCFGIKTRRVLTGDIEIKDFLFLCSTIDQFLAGLINYQDFPL